MRVFVTGSAGFVGGWLIGELRAAGHLVVEAPGPDEMDIADVPAVTRWLASTDGPPDAIAHLAGMAFAPDARSDPAEAFRVNVGGTLALFEALRSANLQPAVLVAGSSEVYGRPTPMDLPLTERSPIAPAGPYGLSKYAQETVAIEAARRQGIRVVATRSFNHTGPGQRPVFVVPAMAQRVLDVRDGHALSVPAGNVDVRRDITDVRDVVRAYRLLLELVSLEAVGGESTAPQPLIVNVSSGTAISIRGIVDLMFEITGASAPIHVDPLLVRAGDPEEIRGDSALIRSLTGWTPQIPLRRTLSDLIASL
jgi:GDP-4-dehydro-6-deoxy-D-mannose reductase